MTLGHGYPPLTALDVSNRSGRRVIVRDAEECVWHLLEPEELTRGPWRCDCEDGQDGQECDHLRVWFDERQAAGVIYGSRPQAPVNRGMWE